jgi:hypothetical protein
LLGGIETILRKLEQKRSKFIVGRHFCAKIIWADISQRIAKDEAIALYINVQE